MDTTEKLNDMAISMLETELARNEETISSLRARNIDITIRLVALEYGISVGDVVCTPNGTKYRVCEIITDRWLHAKRIGNARVPPWIRVNPHTKDGIGWEDNLIINLYSNWRKVP